MYALAKSDRGRAGKLARDVLAHTQYYAPVVVTEAAQIRFDEARTATTAELAQLCKELIPILEGNIARFDNDEGTAPPVETYAMKVGLLGICNELLGNVGAAEGCYSRGLQANPENEGLLVARGILLYGSGPRAIVDLERAVQLRATVIWPYLFLAHHFLITSRFGVCRAICETGLAMRGELLDSEFVPDWHCSLSLVR